MNASIMMSTAVLFATLSVACESGRSGKQAPDQPGSAAGAPSSEAPAPSAGQVDMAEMANKAEKLMKPSANHQLLGKFIGEWNTELRITMHGQETPAEKGTTTCTWLMEGRWVRCEATGTMMGMPVQSFVVIGYDNFKMSYRTVAVSSLDTAMNTSEGDLDPGGKALITYGTIDEYLTGEHDKMVKYVWRFASDDKLVSEVHDLPIGETGTKVVEMTYVRRKSS